MFIQLSQHCLLNPVKINRHMGEPGRRWGGQKGTLVRGGLGWPRAQGAYSYTALPLALGVSGEPSSQKTKRSRSHTTQLMTNKKQAGQG